MIFPRLLTGDAATAQDILQQLLQFERMDPARHREISGRQLLELIRHAHTHSPFWKSRLDAAGFAPESGIACFPRLPILTRRDLAENLPAMRARGPEIADDKILHHSTSGSTGQPVTVEKFQPVYAPLFLATTLLDHHRHARDSRKTLGSYTVTGDDADDLGWGAPLSWFGPTGRMYRRRLVERPVEELYDAVLRHRPQYILSNPTVIRALAGLAEARAQTAPPVEQFMSWAGPVTPELRDLAGRVFGGARITDRYSCEEVGYIALQCAKHDHLHVINALTLVEIADDEGRPCPTGVPGRVLLSSLHSFAMPILRYEVGDLAQWGPPCDCGLTTPVIEKVLGRSRDLITLPNGARRFVAFGGELFTGIAPVREFKVLLHSDGVIEFIARAPRALSADEKTALTACLQQRFDYPYRVVIRQVDDMRWGGFWKRKDFVQTGRPYGDGPGTAAMV
ncbi:MAG: phenylacetate--CoA ligase family protein [Panacagrimonas sp.]